MPGVKGMRHTRGHRAFTYMEKKFNSLGRQGLMDYFKRKTDPDSLMKAMHEEYGLILDRTKGIDMGKRLDIRLWEGEDKEKVGFLVDMILGIADSQDITNIEAYAHYCHMMLGVERVLKSKTRPLGTPETQFRLILERESRRAYELRQDDWNRFMRVLKLVT